MSLFAAASDACSDEPANPWTAAASGNLAFLQAFFLAGDGANPRDQFGYTPLHAAAAYGHAHILRWYFSLPMAAGVDPNVPDDDGDTPIHHCERRETALILISESGGRVDPSVRNGEGKTALESKLEELHNAVVEMKSMGLDASMEQVCEQEDAEVSALRDLVGYLNNVCPVPLQIGRGGGDDMGD